MEFTIPYLWKPRAYQLPVLRYFANGGKRAVTVWHRRAGKDETALHKTCISLHTEPGTYWHMLPEASQGRKAIWTAINPHTGIRRIDEAFPKQLRASTNEQEMFIRFTNGATWQLVGSDNYNSLVGAPPRGVVFSEWALANPSAWPYIRPILRENGGWAWFIYTPRGKNHGYSTLQLAKSEKDWFNEVLTAEQTGVFTAKELEDERRELCKEFGENEGEAYFRQEYYCSFDAAIMGAYYTKEIAIAESEKRICSVPWQPDSPVYTAWDLGVDDSTAIWFMQRIGQEIHLIDYLENSGQGLAYYAKELNRKPYTYAEHLLPHDAEARELGTGVTRVETLENLGLDVTVVPRHDVADGINAVRTMFGKCWFDREKTDRGVEALRQYSRKWDDERKVFIAKPLHDWSSHASDAFRYLALALPEKERIMPAYRLPHSFMSA